MNTPDLTSELFDIKFSIFRWMLFVSLGVSVWITTLGLFETNRISSSWFLLTIVLALSFLLQKFLYRHASIFACIAGLILSIGLYQWSLPVDHNITYLFVVPIIMAAVLLSNKDVVSVTAVTMITFTGITLSRNAFLPGFQILLEPVTVCLFCGFMLYVWNYQMDQYFYWTNDSQQKNYVRAESFYQQREKLNSTVLELKHVTSKLENLNKQLEEAREKLEKASNAKSIFLSNMSHELRTPLSVIIGYSSSMLEMPIVYQNIVLPEIYKADIQLIKESGHYLVSLINDILDLSKVEAGKLEIQPTRMNITDLFKGVIASSTGLLKGKAIQLQHNCPPDLPEVHADPLRIRQVLLNLMSNAIKFTATGSVTLMAQVDGKFVTITVADTGMGIPEKALTTIFDRFQQIATSTDKHIGGTGLGLDISKQLVLLHGSDITVKSTVGRGSAFSFQLPIAAQPDTSTSSEPVNDNIVVFSEVQSTATYFTLLVVDSDMPQKIRQELENNHYIVIDTNNIAEALELAQSLIPNAILLNMEDEEILLAALRADTITASIPVICHKGDTTAETILNNLKQLV